MNAHCAVIDWGTSSFRIWLIGRDGTVLAERRSDEGMTSARQTGFADVMEAHLQALQAAQDLPVVICGMAGSRQGWQEARYLSLPAGLADVVNRAVRVDGLQRDVRILPGLAQHDPERPDVMRGEETQLLGCMPDASAVACLPGTHSKWVRIASGTVKAFSTYMTGELFGLIARQSILRHAIGSADSCDPASDAFLKAVAEAGKDPASLSRLLFSVRAGQLLTATGQTEGYERLSGLLIGSEIAAAQVEYAAVDAVRLIATGKLSQLYLAAFDQLGFPVVQIDADDAVLKGLIAGARQFWPIATEQQGRLEA